MYFLWLLAPVIHTAVTPVVVQGVIHMCRSTPPLAGLRRFGTYLFLSLAIGFASASYALDAKNPKKQVLLPPSGDRALVESAPHQPAKGGSGIAIDRAKFDEVSRNLDVADLRTAQAELRTAQAELRADKAEFALSKAKQSASVQSPGLKLAIEPSLFLRPVKGHEVETNRITNRLNPVFEEMRLIYSQRDLTRREEATLTLKISARCILNTLFTVLNTSVERDEREQLATTPNWLPPRLPLV